MRGLRADLHTHTVASGHGFSTVGEMAASAAIVGLDLIAIADHGPGCPGGAHPYHFWNLKVLPSVLGGVRILKGIEANIMAEDGSLDLPEELLRMLDFVSVGFHPECGFDDGDVDRNTRALLGVLANPLVDAITHPGNDKYPVHLAPVVEAAVRHNVILELNAHSFDPLSSRAGSEAREREFAAAAFAAGAPLAIGSDAHFHLHVGRFEHALAIAEELGIGPDDLVNRDADTVLAFLTNRRERPRLHVGGEW